MAHQLLKGREGQRRAESRKKKTSADVGYKLPKLRFRILIAISSTFEATPGGALFKSSSARLY